MDRSTCIVMASFFAVLFLLPCIIGMAYGERIKYRLRQGWNKLVPKKPQRSESRTDRQIEAVLSTTMPPVKRVGKVLSHRLHSVQCRAALVPLAQDLKLPIRFSLFYRKNVEITVRILQFREKTLSLRSENNFGRCRFKDNRTRLHPTRTAGGSFFLCYMGNQKPRTVTVFITDYYSIVCKQ